MNYILMNKNTPVVSVNIINDTIIEVKDVINPEYLPVGVKPDSKELNAWWKGRAIPASRDGLKESLLALGVNAPDELLLKSFGLSLSDQYWVNPSDNKLKWAEINFFDNDFSQDVGETIFAGRRELNKHLDLCSPDNTSDGWLKKKWIIKDGERYLVKAGSRPFRQEPFNEIIATSIFKRLGIEHVQYKLHEVNKEPCSICKNFITKDTELVTAWYINKSVEEQGINAKDQYGKLINAIEGLGINDAHQFMGSMFAVDYIIANSDRHMGNFGVIRNVNTLKFIGTAPIYDSGTSLWYNEEQIDSLDYRKCKPFHIDHDEQIKLVQDFSKIDFSKLQGIEEEAEEILKQDIYIKASRRQQLCEALAHRVKLLEQHIARKNQSL